MVSIQQNYKLSELSSLLSRYGSTKVKLNEQAIKDDINKIEEYSTSLNSDQKNSKYNKKNTRAILKYLHRILKKAELGEIDIKWAVDNSTIKSYPIEMKSIPEYGIQSTDYINLNDENIVHLDYSELADIIAFELMSRDLGETHKDIEKKLSNVGIITVSNSYELTRHFEDSPYTLSKCLKVEDSPYKIGETRKILDYFGQSKFNAETYREVVSHSCNIAMALVVESLLSRVINNTIKVKLCSVTETGVHLIVKNGEEKDIRELLTERVFIRTFGRKLEVIPKVQIF